MQRWRGEASDGTLYFVTGIIVLLGIYRTNNFLVATWELSRTKLDSVRAGVRARLTSRSVGRAGKPDLQSRGIPCERGSIESTDVSE